MAVVVWDVLLSVLESLVRRRARPSTCATHTHMCVLEIHTHQSMTCCDGCTPKGGHVMLCCRVDTAHPCCCGGYNTPMGGHVMLCCGGYNTPTRGHVMLRRICHK